jgi:hypothetical protein
MEPRILAQNTSALKAIALYGVSLIQQFAHDILPIVYMGGMMGLYENAHDLGNEGLTFSCAITV